MRVSVCGCLTLSVPGVAGARAGCPEAPVTCKVAKGEFCCIIVVDHTSSIHLLQPHRSQVLRSGPARAPAKPGKHVSYIRTH